MDKYNIGCDDSFIRVADYHSSKDTYILEGANSSAYIFDKAGNSKFILTGNNHEIYIYSGRVCQDHFDSFFRCIKFINLPRLSPLIVDARELRTHLS